MEEIAGPGHKEIGSQFLRAMQVGVGAPTQRISKRNSTDNASWGGAPTQRISKRNSTDNASWGGPDIKKYFFYRN
ncbi:conserved hypothetical protein [Staphylococcus argenteus]|uniref:Nitrogen regulation protein NIFR3 n=2 Tax=Staphylococcus argenteus TaxID=985002 RepID=A0A7U7JRN0_9STAP|nr:hypothetical protein CKO49_13080 [Staphylococcus argenteus]OAF02361.1 hypothetical protein AXJ26_12520 [Staphylococcus argenteus]OMH88538.1 hypothetical protein A4R30_10235 [Staphylococcus argenteus]OMH90815.1 hypothetical protein A4R31_08395 [Staphylococcus argenteus]OMH94250.1 hypothetical protein A4R32_11320 [Staphylococcus argenteus]